MKWGLSTESILWFGAMIILISVAFIDLDTLTIPDNLMFGLAVCALGLFLLNLSLPGLLSRVSAAFIGSGLILVLIVISGGGMGLGDAKLVGILGLLLGSGYLALCFFCATVIGAVTALFLLFVGKKRRKDPIPFGPFLVIGSFISIFIGESIIQWYLLSFNL